MNGMHAGCFGGKRGPRVHKSFCSHDGSGFVQNTNAHAIAHTEHVQFGLREETTQLILILF